jgi:hypothetical protein
MDAPGQPKTALSFDAAFGVFDVSFGAADHR